MESAQSNRELTSTLHLGLRSVSGEFPTLAIDNFLEGLEHEEREILEGVIATGGKSAMLFIARGPGKGSRFLIEEDAAHIGRATSSAVFFDDVTVSRKHAVITRGFPGDFVIEDLGSLNGTYVNNESITTASLQMGDEIQIGKYHLLFIGAKSEKNSTTGESK